MGVAVGDDVVMAMSFFTDEGEPLWSRYSTHAIAQALETFSKVTVPYPWPVAISVNGPVGGGMEYPMISFNAPRPEDDGTYSKRQKYGLISVIIHEVGHNWFPMIINTDERQWTWMDEGFNTFVQALAEQRWEKDYPSWNAEPAKIAPYMKRTDDVPIMTPSDSLLHFGQNAYGKTSVALLVLREVVLGDALFDFAFREYARRWQFKRPQPADFFRTMEDASGMDLDWFWRGWFYGTDHVDVAVDKVTVYRLETRDPETDMPAAKAERDEEPETRTEQRYAGKAKRVDRHPALKDFYNDFDDLDITPQDREGYESHLESLEDPEKETLKRARDGKHFTVIRFKNIGGLVTPLLLRITYEDDSTEDRKLPAEIWRKNHKEVKKLFITSRAIKSVEIDPQRTTADADVDNNLWPPQHGKATF
ncbi:MAG: M1 family aminopeptidase, partial [Myxococcota bacterium]|nr:M1 family aminopeptidase [Myxococcota bacterium]